MQSNQFFYNQITREPQHNHVQLIILIKYNCCYVRNGAYIIVYFAFENNSVKIAYYCSPRVTWNVCEVVIFYHWTIRNLARFVHTWSRLKVTQYYYQNHRCSYHKRRNAISKPHIAVADEHLYTRESSQKRTKHIFYIRDDSWVGVCFPSLYTLCLWYVRHVHVSSTYLSGDLGPMFCTPVICAYSATCAELWLIVFRCPRSGVTIWGPRERLNVGYFRDISNGPVTNI